MDLPTHKPIQAKPNTYKQKKNTNNHKYINVNTNTHISVQKIM